MYVTAIRVTFFEYEVPYTQKNDNHETSLYTHKANIDSPVLRV